MDSEPIPPLPKHHGLGDSLAIVALAVAVITWALSPNLFAKGGAVLAGISLLVYLSYRSHFVRHWLGWHRHLAATTATLVVVILALWQLIPEWRQEHHIRAIVPSLESTRPVSKPTLVQPSRSAETGLQPTRKKELGDVLLPAGLPAPKGTRCPTASDAFTVYLANSAYVATGTQSIFAEISPGGAIQKELLDVSVENGRLFVNAAIFDDRQDLVAKIERNQFISTPFAAYHKRPDKSTYLVYDHLDREVLDVQFLNAKAILIKKARFYNREGTHLVEVDGDHLLLDGGKRGDMGGNCYTNIRNIVAILPN